MQVKLRSKWIDNAVTPSQTAFFNDRHVITMWDENVPPLAPCFFCFTLCQLLRIPLSSHDLPASQNETRAKRECRSWSGWEKLVEKWVNILMHLIRHMKTIMIHPTDSLTQAKYYIQGWCHCTKCWDMHPTHKRMEWLIVTQFYTDTSVCFYLKYTCFPS